MYPKSSKAKGLNYIRTTPLKHAYRRCRYLFVARSKRSRSYGTDHNIYNCAAVAVPLFISRMDKMAYSIRALLKRSAATAAQLILINVTRSCANACYGLRKR